MIRDLFEATTEGKPRVVEYEPDGDLHHTELVPLLEAGGIEACIGRELQPYAPDTWYDPASVKVGCEISFTRYLYNRQRLRSLVEIRAEILALEKEAEDLLAQITRHDQR